MHSIFKTETLSISSVSSTLFTEKQLVYFLAIIDTCKSRKIEKNRENIVIQNQRKVKKIKLEKTLSNPVLIYRWNLITHIDTMLENKILNDSLNEQWHLNEILITD